MNEEEVMVKRANVYLRVPKEQAKEYIAKGFDVLDAEGNVTEYSVPNDVNVLKQAYVEHLAKIKALEDELAEAKKAKATKTASTKNNTTKSKSTSTKKKD
jgi:hypothetical protein